MTEPDPTPPAAGPPRRADVQLTVIVRDPNRLVREDGTDDEDPGVPATIASTSSAHLPAHAAAALLRAIADQLDDTGPLPDRG